LRLARRTRSSRALTPQPTTPAHQANSSANPSSRAHSAHKPNGRFCRNDVPRGNVNWAAKLKCGPTYFVQPPQFQPSAQIGPATAVSVRPSSDT
jgi:hypothetical protein